MDDYDSLFSLMLTIEVCVFVRIIIYTPMVQLAFWIWSIQRLRLLFHTFLYTYKFDFLTIISVSFLVLSSQFFSSTHEIKVSWTNTMNYYEEIIAYVDAVTAITYNIVWWHSAISCLNFLNILFAFFLFFFTLFHLKVCDAVSST